MGIFSNRGADDIIRESALGAANMSLEYDNIALEREKKREAEARRQAEAEASAMAARANAAAAQAKAAASENDSLKAELLDYQFLVNDLANRMSDPRLNLIWRVAKSESQAFREKLKVLTGIIQLERRYRQVFKKLFKTLENDYGIPCGKIDTLMTQYYKESCQTLDDDSFRWSIRSDHPEDYLFLDDKVKDLESGVLRFNGLLDEMRAAREALAKLQQKQEFIEVEKKAAQSASPK